MSINELKDDCVNYLVDIGVVPKSNQGSYDISEYKLLLNRLSRHIDIEKPYIKICMYHVPTQ